MQDFTKMSREELERQYESLTERYSAFKSRGLSLDMSRGKPGPEQLDLSEGMLSVIATSADCIDNTGMDTRNYGALDGLPEAKRFFAEVFGVREDQIILGGNSSLTMMYDIIAKAFTHGICEGGEPWCKTSTVKFLCPAPGYDRHFAITEHFGVELIAIRMKEDGPDMDAVERLVASDPAIKGIWCVPKYSNPEGKSYSDEVVRRFANLKPAAKDFRIMWDNAYAIHHLYEDRHDDILNILDECEKAGNPDLALMFASTSKVTFPGGGVALLAASPANIAYIKKLMFFQTIGPDKINQLRHVRFFGDAEGVRRHMQKQAAIIRPKFEVVFELLDRELGGSGVADYVTPNGGYFVSVNVYRGCAKRTVALAAEAGVKMTGAGATFPYGIDPLDQNIRIAPTYPSVEELRTAMELFCVCAKIAACEKLLEQ